MLTDSHGGILLSLCGEMREGRARVGCDCRQNVKILLGVLLLRIFMFDPEVDYPGCCVQVE